MCFRGRPHISLVRKKKNGHERGKLASKFTPCSINVAPASVPLQPGEAGFGLI